jgi:hypothetical protein
MQMCCIEHEEQRMSLRFVLASAIWNVRRRAGVAIGGVTGLLSLTGNMLASCQSDVGAVTV